MYPAPTWSKEISSKFTDESSANVYARVCMNLTCDAVLTKGPNFVNLGISSAHTSDEIRSVFILTARIETPTDGYN